jgi:hypothetical protein
VSKKKDPKKAPATPIQKPEYFKEHSQKFEDAFLDKGWRMAEVKRDFVDMEYLPWIIQNVTGRFAFHPEFDRGYFDPKARFFYFETSGDTNKFVGQFNGGIWR